MNENEKKPEGTPAPGAEIIKQVPPNPQEQKPEAGEQKPAKGQQEPEQKAEIKPPEKKEEVKTPEEKKTIPLVSNDTKFDIPEGVNVDDKKMKDFLAVAQKNGLSVAAAQEIVNMDIKASQEAVSKLSDGWKAETLKRLGDNAEEKLAEANTAYKTFGDDEFVKLLEATHLNNHPAVVRVFRAIGAKLQSDKHVPGASEAGTERKTLAECLYPNFKE